MKKQSNELKLQTVEKILVDKFGSSVSNISELSSGMFSKAYFYESNGNEFVLRLNEDAKDFKKDIYAFENFGNEIPVPKILEYGKFNEQFYFAVLPMCKGITHNQLAPNEAKKVLPEIINIAEKM